MPAPGRHSEAGGESHCRIGEFTSAAMTAPSAGADCKPPAALHYRAPQIDAAIAQIAVSEVDAVAEFLHGPKDLARQVEPLILLVPWP